MKRAVLALIGVAALAGCAGSQPRIVRGAPPPPGKTELGKLTRLALSAARGAGDPHPTGGIVVPTTRKVAERVDAGAKVDSNQPVYFVLVHGHFTVNGPLPRGAKPPTGTILTLTIDPRTNRTTDFGVAKGMPDVTAMGKAEPLPLGDP